MPGRLIGEDNPVRVIDVFVGGLDLPELHFGWLIPRDRLASRRAEKGTALHGFCIEPAEVPATFLYGLD